MRENPRSAGSRITIDLPDEAATCRLAEDVAAALRPGDLVAVSGDLGSGKTVFARAMIRSASGDPHLDVPSPTFPLRIDYQLSGLAIAHVDLYRVNSEDDALELGLDEALDEAALIVEWPERVRWPDGGNRLDLNLTIAGEGRKGELIARGSWPRRLERSRRIRAFLERFGYRDAQRLHVVGDASAKSFERIIGDVGETAVLMNSPARSAGPPVWQGRSYDAVAHRALDVLPFLAIASELCVAGIHVPDIKAADRQAGLVLMEDLGTETIAGRAGRFNAERYETAVDLLSEMHRRQWPEVVVYAGETYRVPHYDRDALLIEVSLYADWYLPRSRKTAISDSERQAFFDAWSEILPLPGRFPDCWVMRDYHSPNILWQSDAQGLARLGVIDIQDTLIGHPAYDVASLAQDARVDITDAQEAALVGRYCTARRGWDPGFSQERFMDDYAVLGAQRATKVLGAFVRLSVQDGKAGYESHIPRVRKILARNLAHPVLSGLRVWYHDTV